MMLIQILFLFALIVGCMWGMVYALFKIVGLQGWYVRNSKSAAKFLYANLIQTPVKYLWKNYKRELIMFGCGVIATLIALHQCRLI